MKVVIMAGGKGTRIATIAPDIPKPMIPIDGVPVLEREILSLKSQGFTDIILTVSHMAGKIMHYFGNGRKFGVHIDYYVEKEPLGNAGALFRLRDKLTEDFLLLNADAVFDVDFNRFVAYHRQKGGLATLFTHPNSHPYDSGLIIADGEGRVEKWLAKEDERPKYYKNRVNAGLHVISPKLLDQTIPTNNTQTTHTPTEQNTNKEDGRPAASNNNNTNKENTSNNEAGENNNNKKEDSSSAAKIQKIDLDRQLLKPLAGTGLMFCYDSPEYVKDMGTPERYYQVCKDFKEGIVEGKNLKNKQKAVFLDRDGTINKYVGFLRDVEEFELLPGVAEAIKKINESGYLAIVVTNQPVIARGEVSYAQLEEIHNKMETLLGAEGAYLDGIYFCPHHPDGGYEGEVKELKVYCECRKPKPGMLIQAAPKYNIDLERSWMVGDGENDIKAGLAAGCHTALIGVGEKEEVKEVKAKKAEYGQDETVSSLLDFVERFI